MWWDSSIEMDSDFLQLLPFLNLPVLADYPILPKQIVHLTN